MFLQLITTLTQPAYCERPLVFLGCYCSTSSDPIDDDADGVDDGWANKRLYYLRSNALTRPALL